MEKFVSVNARNFMLDRLRYFPSNAVNKNGFGVYAYTGLNAGGTRVASAVITFADATGGEKKSNNIPTLNIPSGHNVLSIGIGTFGANVETDVSIFAYKNTVGDFTFPDGGLIRIDEVLLKLLTAPST